ncbi:MAG: PEP-CTERM sorting domain-containing protein [Pseudomonadota bacterium]|nr:PEP-CTERM sorting domain-containing protein [Pseudomonadota bacterium]
MKAAIYKGLLVALLFSGSAVNANMEIVSTQLSFELETSCVQQGEAGSIALQTCDMTVSSLEQASQTDSEATSEAYVESSEAVESVASPVPEPSTAALMVLGFGVLSMVAGARLKNI